MIKKPSHLSSCKQHATAAAALLLLLVVLAAPLGAGAVPAAVSAVEGAIEAQKQTVADVLLGLYTRHAGPVLKAATDWLTVGLQQAEPIGQHLPQCQHSNVLLNAGGWPSNWGALSAEEQARHPINLVMMQVAYSSYRPLQEATACLTGMGVEASSLVVVTQPVPEFAATKIAYVFRAGTERVFVVLRGSCEASDVAVNIACRHTAPGDELFGGAAGGQTLHVHHGFWATWTALEREVVAAVMRLLKQVPSREVVVAGHSLGAATASMAALRLHTLLARPAHIGGVWMFAAPRPGSPAFAAAYKAAALDRVTLRMASFMDFAVRAPNGTQSCSSLGSMALDAETQRYQFAHVGRSLLMCPVRGAGPDAGLTEFRVAANGSEVLDCFGSDELDASAATHQLGAYSDAWRRGWVRLHGRHAASLAHDPRLLAVMCEGCTVPGLTFKMQQIRAPARASGPVTCATHASCQNPVAFAAAVSVGDMVTATWSGASQCVGFMCTPPPAALPAPSPATAPRR